MGFEFGGSSVLITGASSGIGESIARQLTIRSAGDRPVQLHLVARSEDRLEVLSSELVGGGFGVEVHVHVRDLAQAGERAALVEDLASAQVDAVVHNAGVGMGGHFAKADGSQIRDMVELNVHGVLELTRSLLPPMIDRGRGLIYVIGSVAGEQPCPNLACYGATKSFVNAFAAALSEELRGTGVVAGVLCPGSTRTEFFERAGMSGDGKLYQTAETVAARAIRCMSAGRVFAVSGWWNRLIIESQRFMPRSWVRRVAGRVMRDVAAN